MITEVHLGTNTKTEEPITPKEICFDLILAGILYLYSVDGVCRSLSRDSLYKEKARHSDD